MNTVRSVFVKMMGYQARVYSVVYCFHHQMPLTTRLGGCLFRPKRETKGSRQRCFGIF
ncbi:UNVERIFIED_CONTAM: hypothetical protein ABID98_003620 [Brevibacillus sp. OAP136]